MRWLNNGVNFFIPFRTILRTWNRLINRRFSALFLFCCGFRWMQTQEIRSWFSELCALLCFQVSFKLWNRTWSTRRLLQVSSAKYMLREKNAGSIVNGKFRRAPISSTNEAQPNKQKIQTPGEQQCARQGRNKEKKCHTECRPKANLLNVS